MRRVARLGLVILVLLGLVATAAPAAQADHTDPREPLAPLDGQVVDGITRGAGTWEHLAHFQGLASPALTGGGTDFEFFVPRGTKDTYGSFGTLGQDEAGAVGQRIFRLTKNGAVAPEWVADLGTAHCAPASTSVTGLQHDVQVAQLRGVTLLSDTTDASGRCHDPGGGGIEILDVTKVAKKPNWKPREIGLVRFPGFTHTNTVDSRRPWIIYSSSSDFNNRNWIDVVNIRSCFGKKGWGVNKRRAACKPKVYRIQLEDEWTQQRDQTTGNLEPGSATCHDITYQRKRLYCAALNATLILDVKKIVKKNKRGKPVKGAALPCRRIPGTDTGAMVTDCSDMDKEQPERARGWRFLGTFNHAGRDCAGPATDDRTCNSNLVAPSDQDVAVSHEADPTADRKLMFVTDERGGGIVPPGGSCAPGIDNPFGNGGAHAFDISDPKNIEYALTPTGDRAVYISEAIVPAETFCDIHVMEIVPGEQRFIAAYYTQGIKIVDWFVTDGRVTFVERSSFTLPNTNTWTAEDFKIQRNPDGTRTYFMVTNDIHRGIDVVSYTDTPNPIGASAPVARDLGNAGLAGTSALVLLGAALLRRRRTRLAPVG